MAKKTKKDDCVLVALNTETKSVIESGKKVLVKKEISSILNQYSIDNDLGIPDFMLADMIMSYIEDQSKFYHKLEKWKGPELLSIT